MTPFVWNGCHEMHLQQGQRRGAVALLIVAVSLYAMALLDDRRSRSEPALAWRDQGPGMKAVEIHEFRGAEGIYFLPAATALRHVTEITENRIEAGSADLAVDPLSRMDAASVSALRGALKITDMPVAKRLALGLPIDVNRATEGELSMVPGIGERTAATIVQMRQDKGEFSELADLKTIPGIKDGKLRELKKYLTTGTNP
jgi:DNA uptake protein ComE-like DNA-binding protein